MEKIQDYCSSEYFLFLDPVLKEHAEPVLSYWCKEAGEDLSFETMEASLGKVARLDMPLAVRRAFPDLLKEFLGYLSATGSLADADQWKEFVLQAESEYHNCFRENGSVRGKTFRKQYTKVGRNDPCPCGSGRKFKKCCMD